MKFVSFFAGIGGIDLGLERAGHECVGQVEIDSFCLKVLEKHWPDTWRHDDILTLEAEDIPEADLWTGGFPCQDISNAGKRAGIHGERSGLFFDFMRLVRQVRPRYLLLENVAALLVRGMGDVLAALAELRYDAEWRVLCAAHAGAPHQRKRVFIIAYPNGVRWRGGGVFERVDAFPRNVEWDDTQDFKSGRGWKSWLVSASENMDGAVAEGDFSGVDDGLPEEVDERKSIGNAVVPQVAEYIGRLLNEC